MTNKEKIGLAIAFIVILLLISKMTVLPDGKVQSEISYCTATVTEVTPTEVIISVGNNKYAFYHNNTELVVGDAVVIGFNTDGDIVYVQ